MPKLISRLDALKVKRAMAPGYYADGGSLYLQVTTNGARSWIYRFMLNGAARYMGLGSLMTVGLAEARQAALEARRLHTAGTTLSKHAKPRASRNMPLILEQRQGA